MFPEEDPLPGAEGQSARQDRDRERGRGHCCLDVSRHVIGSLGGVGVEGIAFRNQTGQPLLEIARHRGVCILLEGQASRGVGDEYRADSLAEFRAADDLLHFTGDLEKTRPPDLDIKGSHRAHAVPSGARSVISVISEGAPRRMGGPQNPVPRLT